MLLALQAGVMIRRYDSGRTAPQQLTITLLTGHQQHAFQRELPLHRQVTNRFTAGGQAGENIQEPVAAQLGLGWQPLTPETLTHKIQH